MIMLLHYILRQNTQLLDPLKVHEKKKKIYLVRLNNKYEMSIIFLLNNEYEISS